jgi:putative sigma-54 modulation protein
MNIHLTGRQIDITEPLRSYTETKLGKLRRFMDGITDIHVILSVEKYRHIAEVNVLSRGNTHLTAVEESNDLYLSIAQAIEKIEAQARKHHGRRRERRRRPDRRQSGTLAVLRREAPGESEAGPRVVESRRFVIKPLSVEEAVAEMDAESAEFLVFRNASHDRVNVIYRRPDGNYGLIDPEA